ncbi:MAG: replicative DNA helicase [Bacteroidetes bacterium HGW-Bacteroidetes-21]|jgi:replicative DNA helicase|nr:MAG: replicative DNA helicase [Bacteroidetes bacterium HGW-Bacteroidetes-21]
MAKRKDDRTPSIESIVKEIGKVPPQAIDLEQAVLGAMMLESESAILGLDILKPECFYHENNRKIFEVIQELSGEHKSIDILTVKDVLSKKGILTEIGGAYYLTELTSRVTSGAHLEFHARIVYQKFIQRELIKVSSEMQRRSFEQSEDVDDILEYGQNELFNLSEGSMKREAQVFKVIMDEAIKQIEEAGKKDDGLSGIPSGFTSLDAVTSGWQNSDLVIIAARPSMGKTAFVLSMCRNMAVEFKIPVALFSLEMASVQLAKRLLVAEAELSAEKVRSGRLEEYEWKQLMHKTSKLMASPLFIDETPALSIFELRAKCRRLVSQNGVKLIVIDYLQLMTGAPENKGNREQEVSTISRSLKALAKELNIPIIALSQLNRSLETRSGDKRPMLSDLRESGAIEQDADIVIFIHRPEKFGFVEREGTSLKGVAQIILAKHRNGAVCDVDLKFIEKFAKFTDWNDPLETLGDNGANGSVVLKSKINENAKDTHIPHNQNFDNESSAAPF